MKIPGSMDGSDDIWAERYIDSDQIEQNLVKNLSCDNFDIDKEDISHQLVAVRYSISKVLSQFFHTAIQNQKNSQNKPIYTKWCLSLPDIKCKNDTTDIFLLPTLAFHKGSISKRIKVLRNIAEWLELTDEVEK